MQEYRGRPVYSLLLVGLLQLAQVDLKQGTADAQVACQLTDIVAFCGQRGDHSHPVRVGERCQHLQQGVSGHAASFLKSYLASANKS